MKVIGLIGGLSWESTLEYYRTINETIREKLGGLHSARCIIYSFDFAEIATLQHQAEWDETLKHMIRAGQSLRKAGADLIVICSNTMHKQAEEIEAETGIPLLHIADPTGELIAAQGMARVGLLGTRFTMEGDFYKGRLVQKYGIDVVIPTERQRQTVHDIIYDELCRGEVRLLSKQFFKKVIEDLVARGAQGIILGCTEIPMLVKQEDSPVPLFDTTMIHAKSAVEYALNE